MAVTYSGKLTISGKLKSFIESVVSVLPDWSIATEQQKLTASDGSANDEFGRGVAISGDGNIIMVGSPLDNTTGGSNAGSVYVFTQSGGTWVQQQKLLASDGALDDEFGRAVAISADGSTAIFSAHNDDPSGSNSGSAYIFINSSGIWSQQAKLQALDAQADDKFSWSVGISSDGNTAIVSAHDEDQYGSNAGAAYIFTRSGVTWTQQQKLTASDAAAGDNFGYSLAISGDGNTAIVGSYQDDNAAGSNAGSAYVFIQSGGTWIQQQKLLASDAASSDQFGISVAISSDGNTAIVGAYLDDNSGGNDAGSAYVFTRTGGVWTEQTRLQASDAAASDQFGRSAALSADGNVAIVGAYYDDLPGKNDAGSAYVFTRSGGVWTEQAKLTASDSAANDFFGFVVDISSDGSVAVSGSYADDNSGGSNAGSAYVFVAG